jgi:hypothetical protein
LYIEAVLFGAGVAQHGIPSSPGSQIEIKDGCGVSGGGGDENVKRSFRKAHQKEK